jgi:hypothetical protein
MKKLFAALAIFALALAGCELFNQGNNDGNNDNGENATTLRIKNESFIEITDVVWNNVSFTGSQESINTGLNVVKNVESGAGYIYFKRKGSPIAVRTNTVVVVDGNTANEFVFTNNVLITEVANVGNTDTLVTFYTRTYVIGDTGPGGGTVFFAEGGQYKECSGELGIYNWSQAWTTAMNFKGGGVSDWQLPDRGELDLMYQNVRKNGLGGFFNEWYWSSTYAGRVNIGSYVNPNYIDCYYAQTFHTSGTVEDYYEPGSQEGWSGTATYRVRAVRAFSQW